jgi:hypothetical protein
MRGNRIIPTIGNLGMHKLYIADAKSSFGRQIVVSSIHEPGASTALWPPVPLSVRR